MKVKTSVTISKQLITAIDKVLNENQNRSTFLETAAWEHIARIRRAKINRRDVALINQYADQLNAETLDTLVYQIPL